MRILHVVGARPNFMKIAPIMQEIRDSERAFEQILLHTGQHYDQNMSRVFFEDLGLPRPDINLDVGSGSHAEQTAQIMIRFEPVLLDVAPDLVMVVGDVNSTLACSLVASKLGVPVAHVEAGLRSFDRRMPEEINRIITDQLADLLFTHSQSANRNLIHEGIPEEKIHFVGNVMIDTLVRLLPDAQARWPELQAELGLDRFILVTLHRDFNVDNPAIFQKILTALERISEEIPVFFPVHPRTRKEIEHLAYRTRPEKIRLVPPVGYLDFLALQQHASLVVTDSGGIQEETTYLGVPCLTLRPNTERPVTLTVGTNELAPAETEQLYRAMRRRLDARDGRRQVPELWDGQASRRIVQILASL